MEKMAYTELAVGDVVLAEVFVKRWETSGGDGGRASATPSPGKGRAKGEKYKKKEWKEWAAKFNMQAISLMCKAPVVDDVPNLNVEF